MYGGPAIHLSRDHGSHHSIRHSRKPDAARKVYDSMFYIVEPELLPIEVLRCGNEDFRPFLTR